MGKIKSFYILMIMAAYFLCFSPAMAITDPLSSPNNKFGIHIISVSSDEASPAAQLVNSSGGDWGYITVLVESKNRNHEVWQKFFDDLRRRHLIPIIRLATHPDGSNWKLPYEGEEQAWADFLDNLVWPVKNRYVVIYNEPNHGQEWAGRVDAASYAQVLDKTITALKNKNPDFFVLNAGFDASAPSKMPLFEDEARFLEKMEETVPGIFEKLDGWTSHSYPNPGFSGSPDGVGRGTVRTYLWEKEFLKELGVKKDLPIFITETGWKHAEGLTYQKFLPTAEKLAEYFPQAFRGAWNNSKIVAVTPFLLNYQEVPFDHFSFKKIIQDKKEADYYPFYQTIRDLPKIHGQPVQENKAEVIEGSIYSSIVLGEKYLIPLKIKNIGQSIWNDEQKVSLKVVSDNELGIKNIDLPEHQKIEPNQFTVFKVEIQGLKTGTYPVSLQLFTGNQAFDSSPFNFSVSVKSPAILIPRVQLLWKDNPLGEYILKVKSDLLETTDKVIVNQQGEAKPLEARHLLPDYSFQFTLYKTFYQSKTITQTIKSGKNILDFGTLTPDFLAVLFKPREFWKLLPFSQ